MDQTVENFERLMDENSELQDKVDELTASIQLMMSQAGIPDASEACRQIIKTGQLALAERGQE